MTSILTLYIWAVCYSATQMTPKGPDLIMSLAHVDISCDWQCSKDKVLPWKNIHCSKS